MNLVYLVTGGALGTLSRYWLSGALQGSAGSSFPYGTLAVNVLGCLVIGFLAAFGAGKLQSTPGAHLFFMVGFCGAFTTFSTLILETDHLFKSGQMLHAYGNILVSLAAGFAAFALGGWIGSKI